MFGCPLTSSPTAPPLSHTLYRAVLPKPPPNLFSKLASKKVRASSAAEFAFSFHRGPTWLGGFPKHPQEMGLPGTAEQRGAARLKNADTPASQGGWTCCLLNMKGHLVSRSGPMRLSTGEPGAISCPLPVSWIYSDRGSAHAAREIPSILKMTRLNLLDQDSCVVQRDENYTNSSMSNVNGRSLPAQGHVT